MADYRIEDYLDLVREVADQLVREIPSFAPYRDDMVGAGHLKLVELRDRDDIQPDSVRAYVRTAVRRAMLAEAGQYIPEPDSMPKNWLNVNTEGWEDEILQRIDLERYLEGRRK